MVPRYSKMEIIKIYILINAHMVSAVAVVWWLGVRICVKSVYTSTGWAQGYRDTGAGDQGTVTSQHCSAAAWVSQPGWHHLGRVITKIISQDLLSL